MCNYRQNYLCKNRASLHRVQKVCKRKLWPGFVQILCKDFRPFGQRPPPSRNEPNARYRVGAKGVAQSVGFARHFRAFAQFHKMLLECDFVACPEFAGCQRAEWFKPCGQRGADFHKATLRGFWLLPAVTSMCPGTRQTSAQSKRNNSAVRSPANPPMAMIGRSGFSRQRSSSAANSSRRVKFHCGGVRPFGAHGVGFKQAVRRRQIIFADCPLQKLPDGGAVVVAAFGGTGGAAIAGLRFSLCRASQ